MSQKNSYDLIILCGVVVMALAMRKLNWKWPVPSGKTLKGSWQNNRGDHIHRAIDIMAPEGSPILAVQDGLVKTWNNPKGGNAVKLFTSDGYQVYYAHMLAPVADRQVRKGEIIGYVGKTGNAAHTDPHLHISVEKNGVFYNLENLI